MSKEHNTVGRATPDIRFECILMKICFVAPDAYAAVINAAGSHIGGAETQQIQFANSLRLKGYEVSFIVARAPLSNKTDDIGLPSWVKVAYALRDHPSNLGFIRDSFKLFNAMRAIGADVYIQRCSFHDSPRVWLFSKLLGAKFLFWVGIDYNVDIEWLKINLSPIRRKSYLYAIQHADVIVCQTQVQADMLHQVSRSPYVIIRNIVKIPCKQNEYNSKNRLRILWGGRINVRKNPDVLVELAKQSPRWDFIVVAVKERGLEELYESFLDRAKDVTNIEVIRSLPHRDYLDLHDSIDLVLNTSSTEGYPNTLLEAFARRVPALTLGIDPDNSIEQNAIGWVCSDIDEASETLRKLADQPELLAAAGRRAFSYVQNSHGMEIVVGKLESLILTLEENKSE